MRSEIEVFLRCENYVQAVNVVGFAMLYVVTHRLMKRETIISTGARHQQWNESQTTNQLWNYRSSVPPNTLGSRGFFFGIDTEAALTQKKKKPSVSIRKKYPLEPRVTPQEFIIPKLNPLLVVDFRLISTGGDNSNKGCLGSPMKSE